MPANFKLRSRILTSPSLRSSKATGAKTAVPHDVLPSVGAAPTLVGGAGGALGLGGIAALVTYLQRQAKSEGVVELIERLADGGTRDDLFLALNNGRGGLTRITNPTIFTPSNEWPVILD